MKIGAITCLALFVLAALLILLQLWFSLISSPLFVKLLATVGILFCVVLGVTLVRKEYIENKALKKDKYID